jgi:hypothetical protein
VHVRETNVFHRHGIRRAALFCTDVAGPGFWVRVRTNEEQIAHILSVRCKYFHHQLERSGRNACRDWDVQYGERLIRNVDFARRGQQCPGPSGERRSAIGIEVYCHRLTRAAPGRCAFNRELNRRDIVLLAAGKGVHIKGTPVTIVGVTNAVIA